MMLLLHIRVLTYMHTVDNYCDVFVLLLGLYELSFCPKQPSMYFIRTSYERPTQKVMHHCEVEWKKKVAFKIFAKRTPYSVPMSPHL